MPIARTYLRANLPRFAADLAFALLGVFACATTAHLAGGRGIAVLFTAGVAFALGVLVFRQPHVGLVIALMVNHNPYYNYVYLALSGMRDAGLRAGMSTVCFAVLTGGIVVRASADSTFRRLRTPADKPLLLLLTAICLSTIVACIRGNEFRQIIYQMFPIVEFSAYYWLGTLVIQTRKHIRDLLRLVGVWILVNMLFEIGIFLFTTQRYGVRIPIGGLAVNRIPCYLSPIFLCIFFAGYVYTKNRKTKLVLLVSVFWAFTNLALSFWRSLYLGALGGLLCLFLVLAQNRYRRSMVSTAVFVTITVLVGGHFVTALKSETLDGTTLSRLILARAMNIIFVEEDVVASHSSRLEHNAYLPHEIMKRPVLGTGLGGATTMPSGEYLYYVNGSNYYLNIAGAMGFPGLLLLMYTFACILKAGFKASFMVGDELYQGISLGIMAGFVAMGIVLVFFPSLVHFPVGAYLGVGAALIFQIGHRFKKEIL